MRAPVRYPAHRQNRIECAISQALLLGREEKPQRLARRPARVILDQAASVTVAMKELVRILPQLLFLQHRKTG
jgi:hypothetical protein